LRLSNEELLEANRELERVSRHKSAFLANMSHELRTPLNAIIGFSEILHDQSFGELNEKQLSYAQNVVTAGKHLLQLINQILDLAKVESGKMTLNLESFPVSGAIAEIAGMARGLAAKKDITVRHRLSPEITTITADRKKFTQIFNNLLGNAIKFTAVGGWVEISSSVIGEYELAGGGQVVQKSSAEFCVKDNGIGIAEEDREDIFLEFRQLDASHSREYEGTGLGLALTKKLIELHGGSIWVESEKGKGCSFYFTVPLAEEDLDHSLEAPEKAGRAQAGPARAPREKAAKDIVLVVEDDRRSFELMATYLEEAGYEVVRAATGAQALRAARQNRPALIALDIILPDIDGWTVLQRLKAQDETSHIPVVITSVLQDEDTAFSLGASDYIVKPVTRKELVECVERLGENAASVRIVEILVVDDDEDFVNVLASTLEGESFSVAKAYTGLQGIEHAAREKPDLIFLDLLLPDISGFEVVEFLKMNESTKEIPIIIVTGKDLTPEEKQQLNGKIEAAARKGHHGKNDFLGEIKRVERLASARKGEG
jgi:DNA-binding response OmpR family regulator/nitrogen-specific signal transduction histidine kinase